MKVNITRWGETFDVSPNLCAQWEATDTAIMMWLWLSDEHRGERGTSAQCIVSACEVDVDEADADMGMTEFLKKYGLPVYDALVDSICEQCIDLGINTWEVKFPLDK